MSSYSSCPSDDKVLSMFATARVLAIIVIWVRFYPRGQVRNAQGLRCNNLGRHNSLPATVAPLATTIIRNHSSNTELKPCAKSAMPSSSRADCVSFSASSGEKREGWLH